MNHSRAEVLVLGAKTETMRWHKPALSESSFRKILSIAGAFVLLLLLAIFFSLVIASFPAIRNFGIRFLFSTTWDPVRSEFGAFPFLVGTLATSFLALIISVVFSIPISIFLGEYSAQGATPTFIKSMIELLAGVPSVIYGFCGLFLLAPLVRILGDETGCGPLRGGDIHCLARSFDHDHTLFGLDRTRGDQPRSFRSQRGRPLSWGNPI